MKSILIIEDDQKLNAALSRYFSRNNYLVDSLESLKDVKKAIRKKHYDLIISDISLPGEHGLTLPSLVETSSLSIPIIFLTGKDERSDILAGYEVGGIDYIVKPIHPDILLKRVEVALKYTQPSSSSHLLVYRDLTFDTEKRILLKSGFKLALTPKELKLIEYLFANIGKVLTKDSILENVWDIDGDFVGENTVSVTINRLRKKLQSTSPDEYIQNIFGLGYLFGE